MSTIYGYIELLANNVTTMLILVKSQMNHLWFQENVWILKSLQYGRFHESAVNCNCCVHEELLSQLF